MFALGLALIAQATMGADAASYELALHTEARGRSAYAGEASSIATGELQLDPSAAATFTLEQASVLINYSPRLLLVEPYVSGRTVDVLHRGRVEAGWHLSPTTRMLLFEQLSLGQNTFSPLVAPTQATPLTPVDRLPSAETAAFVDSRSSIGLESSLTRRLRLSVGGAYLIAGGATHVAQVALPLANGPEVTTKLEWSASRRDILATSLFGTHLTFSTGAIANLANAVQTWQHRIADNIRLELGPGVAVARTRVDVLQDQVLPVAVAGVIFDDSPTERRLEISFHARLWPTIDRLNGAVYQRAEGVLGVEYNLLRQLRLSAHATTAQGLSGSAEKGERLSYGEFSGTYVLSRELSIAAGSRAIWLTPPVNTPASSTFQWVLFVGATLSERGIFL